jgi:LacI family transcriptional regulator/LacI family repressor for deo operon, udp, cdd, tsx, nupC, and nupG
MATTIRDVARVAGVGVGTVSRVLNDSPRVDPATRAKVRAAIKELDYVPSAIARSLSTGRTGAIGVIVPFLTRPSVVERLRGVEAALSGSPYDLVVFNIETPERRETVIRLLVRRDRVDGVIILSLSPHPAEVAQIDRADVPTVLVDAHHRAFTRVVVDDVAGGRLAAEYLIGLGHRRIGFLGDDPATRFKFSPSRLRRVGVARALRAAGLEMRSEHVRLGGFQKETARRIAAELLATTPPPTAIICGSDVEALGVLDAARGLGVAVPAQLSVVGYDDIEIAGDLGLTTIRQPLFESGRRGAEMLLAAMSGTPGRIVRELLPVELIVRTTTGPPPA